MLVLVFVSICVLRLVVRIDVLCVVVLLSVLISVIVIEYGFLLVDVVEY